MALAVSAPKRARDDARRADHDRSRPASDSVYPFYSGVFLPAKTPRAIVEKLHGETVKALQAPAVQARLETLGVEPMPMTRRAVRQVLRDDVEEAVALVKAAKSRRSKTYAGMLF